MADPLGERLRRVRSRWIDEPLFRSLVAPYRRWRNAGRRFQPLFVAGAMGSGTTLLALALGQRFRCAGTVTESALQIAEGSFLRMRLVASFASVADYRDAILPRADWSVDEGRADLLALYRTFATRAGEAIVDKGPNTNLVRAGFLQRCFPDGRFVLIFRDPVANVEGFRRKWSTFGRDSLEASVAFYREIHERFLADVERLNAPVLTVEYERLVAHHDGTLDALGRLLGLVPEGRTPRLDARRNRPGQGIRNVRDGRIELVPDANAAAYRSLHPSEVERIRAALEPLHRRLRSLALDV